MALWHCAGLPTQDSLGRIDGEKQWKFHCKPREKHQADEIRYFLLYFMLYFSTLPPNSFVCSTRRVVTGALEWSSSSSGNSVVRGSKLAVGNNSNPQPLAIVAICVDANDKLFEKQKHAMLTANKLFIIELFSVASCNQFTNIRGTEQKCDLLYHLYRLEQCPRTVFYIVSKLIAEQA